MTDQSFFGMFSIVYSYKAMAAQCKCQKNATDVRISVLKIAQRLC